MVKQCITKKQAIVFRAAVVMAIRKRKIRLKDIWKAAKVTPQHIVDVLAGDKPISLRTHRAIMKVMRPVWERMAA